VIPRNTRFKLALLLALLLPAQGFAYAPACSPFDGMPAAHHEHCAPTTGAAQHHGCGACCCAIAVATAPLRFLAPPSTRFDVASPAALSPPKGLSDRLDRPPRT